MRIAVVVPAYNEEAHIGRVIDELRAVDPRWDIVVVDDASHDATAREARAHKAVAVLSHALNRGQGAALRTGTRYALLHGADLVVHFDADGQFEAHEVPQLISLVAQNDSDVVFGSRFLGGAGGMPWSKRYIVLPVARYINYLFTGVRLTDAHNGLRVLTRRAAELIQITQDRMAHNSNIVAEVRRNGLRFKEAPVTVHYHRYGQTPWAGFAIIKDLLKEFFFH